MQMSAAEVLLRRDRLIVWAGLLFIIAISWAYTIYLAISMQNMDMGMGMEMAMPNQQTWGAAEFVAMFVMWTVMMVAMMTPSASPMVLTYARIMRNSHPDESPVASTWMFLLGYLLVWTAFSALAVVAQWGLHSAALLSPMMITTSAVLGGVLLIAAGIFQFTPLKHTCLHHCRSPIGYLMTEWQDGRRGALAMGLKHGNYCVGCCWLLMALLFVAGVMNLLWVAFIAAYILIEKVVPGGHWVGRAFGVVAIVWGLWILSTVVV